MQEKYIHNANHYTPKNMSRASELRCEYFPDEWLHGGCIPGVPTSMGKPGLF
jgi:hypothetical protein